MNNVKKSQFISLVTDMNLYGICPAQEEVYLVICKECGKVVKVSTFSRHCGKCFLALNREFLNPSTKKALYANV